MSPRAEKPVVSKVTLLSAGKFASNWEVTAFGVRRLADRFLCFTTKDGRVIELVWGVNDTLLIEDAP